MNEQPMPPSRQLVAGAVLVVPFSELGTKSDASRAKMMDQLLTNIKHVLKDVFHVPWVKYRIPGERIVFSFKKQDVDAALEALEHVPGILRLYQCVETQPRPEAIAKKVGELVQQGGWAFDGTPVEVRALFFGDKRDRESLVEAVSAAVRGFIGNPREPGAPRANFGSGTQNNYIELHPDFAYIALGRREGLNGHPVGTQNPVVAEIVGRQGDLLASLLVIRRGIVITPAFFSIGRFSIDPGRYDEVLSAIKRGIDAFHGFPVKRYFFIPLDEILSVISKKLPSLMETHPCTCCIVARRVILDEIIARNTMTRFVVQGTTMPRAGTPRDSCPAGVALDPTRNPDKLFIESPLLAGAYNIPRVFSARLQALPVPPETGDANAWNFCTLRRRESPGTVSYDDIAAVHGLVKQTGKERVRDLIIPAEVELPPPRREKPRHLEKIGKGGNG